MVRSVVTVSNSLIVAILEGCGLEDASCAALLATVRLPLETVRDVNGRTSIVVLARLWKRVVRQTGDDFIGLRIGASVRSDRFGLAVHAAQHAPDFRSVLEQFAKYASLVNDLIECRLEAPPASPDARLVARLHWNVLGLERHAVDITFAAVVAFARDRLATPLVVREVRLVHGRAEGRAAYERLFAAPLVLGANRNELVFEAAVLDAPVTARDPELGRLLDRYASLELARIPVVTDLPSRIAQILRHHLRDGAAVDLGAVADQLGMSRRSLQRRLTGHATSFSALLDDARRALAPALLAEPDANVEQVGFRLGYSEPTAFIRAFKKWYGVTPGSYRKGAVDPERPR